MTSNPQVVSVEDYEAVAAVVTKGYVKAMAEGDPAPAEAAFHPDAIMYGFAGKWFCGPIDPLYTEIRDVGPAPQMKTRLDVLHMTPLMALVKLELENDGFGQSYTDYHALIKVDGKWQIIAKLFHKYD